MYLSTLLIDVGDNPDRPRPGRLWLHNIYRVHQRLCMAFLSSERKLNDPDFLQPYKTEDFRAGNVRVERKTDAGFLFRVDPQAGGRVVILVQSAVRPDWDYAFHNADFLLAAPPELREVAYSFHEGQRLRFRLLANPTRKVETIRKRERLGLSKDELKARKGRHGKRVPVPSWREIQDWRLRNPDEEVGIFIHRKLLEWLAKWRPVRNGRPADSAGFSIDPDATIVQPGWVYLNKERGKDQGKRLRSARFEGILTVTDSERLKETIMAGIGPAKAFGFGLLSVVPLGSGAT